MYGKEDSSAFSQLASFSPNILLHYIHSSQQLLPPALASPASPTSTSSTLSPTQQSILTPTSFSFTGACMLVDISGFSKFSGEMCKQGVTGLDGLREITNGFLGHFVKKVYEYDGDVIAFAGDALICVFKDTDTVQSADISHTPPSSSTSRPLSLSISSGSYHSLPSSPMSSSSSSSSTSQLPCVYRALLCAHTLRSHHTDHLHTHIALSYGMLHYGVLGGVGEQWVGVLNGLGVGELGEAIGLSLAGEVVATQSCVLALKQCDGSIQSRVKTQVIDQSTSVKVVEINTNTTHSSPGARSTFQRTSSRIYANPTSNPAGSLNHSELSPSLDQTYLLERLTYFTPRPILTAIYSGTIHHIGELRQVTTMFISLDSYDHN
eukprot:gene44688-54648_t